MTEVDFDQISSYERYKLMASLIVPRPIALVTSLGANGVVNAAPFSMFNMIGEDPPILMISINRLQDGQLKDTSANILHNGEFVCAHVGRAYGRKNARLRQKFSI
jgi:flavin reductase (DIM6/NTAB) family NADH-FMN oxidoreductase RutF